MDAKQINQFWSEAGMLVRIAAKYSQRVSLRENLMDESTAWKVKGVLDNYYGGSIAELDRAIANSKRQFGYQVNAFNANCRHYGIIEIKKPDALLELLLDPARRDFYKKAFEKAGKNQTVYRLQDIEISFRKPSA